MRLSLGSALNGMSNLLTQETLQQDAPVVPIPTTSTHVHSQRERHAADSAVFSLYHQAVEQGVMYMEAHGRKACVELNPAEPPL